MLTFTGWGGFPEKWFGSRWETLKAGLQRNLKFKIYQIEWRFVDNFFAGVSWNDDQLPKSNNRGINGKKLKLENSKEGKTLSLSYSFLLSGGTTEVETEL